MALSAHSKLQELGLEELAIVALLARISSYEDGVFRRSNMYKLFKLLFIVTHGAFDEHGRIVGIVSKPRLSFRFRVYLFGVASLDVYRVVERLTERGFLRLEDVDTYVLNIDAGELYRDAVDELRKRNPELARIVEAVSIYAGMESRELEGFVNSLLGLTDPAIKAVFYGVDVAKLVETLKRAGELLERGELVNE